MGDKTQQDQSQSPRSSEMPKTGVPGQTGYPGQTPAPGHGTTPTPGGVSQETAPKTSEPRQPR